jgi:demethylmenaquinone methyltransferase/2-methoxy-6-polyprenyl-1,4-benzoquinol methylase
VTVWKEVEDALEAIIEKYERANHVISLFQDDSARRRGLERAGICRGTSLELGSGPGNFTSMLRRNVEGALVCLDYSVKMLSVARSKLRGGNISFVRGVFEALPFRQGTIELTAAAYALRDSTDKIRALTEVSRVLRRGGKLLIIDIGKPNNPLVRGFFSLYMRYVVPILGGLSGGYGYWNPWSLLYKTYGFLPVNKTLQDILRSLFGSAFLEEHAFGGLVVALAQSQQINLRSIDSEPHFTS